jgi:mono/diheme cytochrome c family protein
MTRKRGMLTMVGILLATACGPGEEETGVGQDEALRVARADSVATAEGIYDSAVFDTIQWETPEAKLERGALVWRVSCVKCHGMEGGGDGSLATEHAFAVPDMGTGDWAWAGDLAAIRHRVFVGHESQMPAWGLYGLSYRDVDAVATHIDAVLGAPAEDE